MFGSLFDDERPAGVMTSVHTLPIPMPPSRRLPCGLSGIENQGATCYLNSLLQTLLYTPEFKEGLFALSDAELGSLENREKGRVRIIPLQLQRLFARLLLVNQQAASTTELTDSFGWSNNEELQQHDVQELNRILFSAIDSSLVGTSGKDLISHLYHGSTITEIVCQICGKISEREEDFLDLNVIVANFSNLQDSLNATFLLSEVMKGKNQYRCSTCCKLVDAKKGLKIQCLPPILTLSLLRFSYDTTKFERFKETGKFVFPFEIDMAPYCNKEQKTEDTVYELFSVLIHSGCSSGGHYHTFIRDVDGLGKWLQPDEETGNSSNGKENNDFTHDPLLLVKAILSESDDHCLPMEFLCAEILKWTGFSWNKKFKSSHGIFAKFLQRHNDMFEFNSGANVVHLKKDAVNHESPPDCSVPSTSGAGTDSVPGSPKETRKHAVMNTLKLNIFDKKKIPNSYGNIIQNWFDFNDSRVSPILVKDIDKQFSGKESAYMLFYRRKSLLRPDEAKGNPKYKMPEKLLRLVEEENLELERLREEYEIALNTVNVQVHLGNNYRCSNGVLEPKLNEVYFVDLSIDKRKLLLDLRDSISKICLELYPSQNFILHTARIVPAGLHLYEELSESQNLESLKDLGITEGTKIFVWDGLQLGGEQFAIGVAHEPVLLNISVTLQNGETTEMSRGFPKTTTVGELKVLISNLITLPLEDIRVSRLDLQGEETRLSPLNENQNLCTLSELSFIDGDNIVAESLKCQNVHRKEVHRITVIVQNCCQSTPTSENGKPQFIELTVEFDNTIEELRYLAVSQLNLDASQNFILRKYLKPQCRRPPLHENETVRENGLVDNSCLTIEEGKPPEKDQITVMFTVGIGIGDPVEHEVTVNKSSIVQECLRRMLDVAGLSGDAWHLRKTNWCGEPMEQLSLDGMTLEDESVQHGETLLIMEGRLPAKGFLSFSIWLFPTLETITNPQSMNMNGIHSGIESLLQNFGETSRDDSNRSVKLGEVELSSDSTVMDLKTSVLTLPLLTGLSLPSIRCLRLQMLDNGKPGKVLRGHQNTLRKLKVQSQSLAARILCTEEDLMQAEILLNVCQRIPDTKSYTPPSELVWDTNKSSSPKSLKQTIADCTGCPIHRLVIAKHFPEKCQWLVIDDGTNSKNTRKKRWGPNKSNIRNSPYYLKDGDTIGVKDRLADPEDMDDFLTSQDIDGQEILKAAAENKRIKRQEDKSPSRSGEWMLGGSDRELPRHAKKGGEPGIKIHVEDFT